MRWFFLLVLLLPGGSLGSHPLIGFCWVSSPLSDMTLFEDGFVIAHHLGCQIEHRQYNWDSIEKEKDTYDWSSLDQWYKTCLKYEIIPSLAVCPVNSNSQRRNFPRDLDGRPFVDSEVIQRLEELTSTLLGRYPRIVYLSYGNEINYYLAAHWDDVVSYLTLCQHMYQYVKENYPQVRVLVIFGFTGMSRREEELISQFAPACDLIGISSYHASVAPGSSTPPRLTREEMREVLEHCISLCGEKRVGIVETAAFSHPNPGYQAEYVQVFFEVARTHGVEFACWLSTYDWYPGTLTMIDPFLEQFSSAGLVESDGTPKPSYYVWMEEMGQEKGNPLFVIFVVIILFPLLGMKRGTASPSKRA